jgi:hypothetical protein
MSEQEYEKYLADMQELEKLRRVKNDFSKIARGHFDRIDSWLKRGTTPEIMFNFISRCQKEVGGEYYCDHCPFTGMFGCPFGYWIEFSK